MIEMKTSIISARSKCIYFADVISRQERNDEHSRDFRVWGGGAWGVIHTSIPPEPLPLLLSPSPTRASLGVGTAVHDRLPWAPQSLITADKAKRRTSNRIAYDGLREQYTGGDRTGRGSRYVGFCWSCCSFPYSSWWEDGRADHFLAGTPFCYGDS